MLLRSVRRPYLFSNSAPAADRRRLAQIHRALPPLHRAARPARGEHPGSSARDDRRRLQHPPRRAPDHADHARRRRPLAAKMAERMLARGVYVIGFRYPVVPQGKARIRTQVSAAHSREDLAFAVEAFKAVKAEMD